jgi:arylsulfatase
MGQMTNKSRSSRVILFLSLGCIALGSPQPVISPSIDRIVLISIDTLRADFLGCYNAQMKTSPELDEFARHNVIFRNVTSQAPTTAPSHKSIFYSVYPTVHKTTIQTIPQEKVKSPVEIIRAAGFQTAAFTGGGQLSHTLGFSKGFDTYWEPKVSTKFKHSFAEMEPAAFNWLEKHYKDKFFLFLHTYEAHCPYDPPEKFYVKWSAWYDGDLSKNTACFSNYLPHPRPTDYEYIRSLYSAEVNYVDSFLGKVFQKLKALGIYENTLIIFLSDHGESLGEKGYVGHCQLYQVQLQVPLILHIPGVGSTQIDAPLELIDVMPTIFDLLKIKSAYPFQGKSIMPLIYEPRVFETNRPLISEEQERVRIRSGDFALSFFPHGEPGEELFDLRTDPQEIEDISNNNPVAVKRLKDRYFQIVNESKNLSSLFILDSKNKREMDPETIEQLKSLGYVAE